MAEHWRQPWINMIWLACTSLTVLASIWRKRSSHRPKAQHAGWGTLQTFVSHPSTNSSYYCYCGETENLLIPISISHQGSEQVQSHLKAIDCGFKSQARRASFTASWNNLCWATVRGEAWTQSKSSGVVISGDLNARYKDARFSWGYLQFVLPTPWILKLRLRP